MKKDENEIKLEIGRWLREKGINTDPPSIAERCEFVANMLEAALVGTDSFRDIWTDADYMTAAIAVLTQDGDRARAAALVYMRFH